MLYIHIHLLGRVPYQHILDLTSAAEDVRGNRDSQHHRLARSLGLGSGRPGVSTPLSFAVGKRPRRNNKRERERERENIKTRHKHQNVPDSTGDEALGAQNVMCHLDECLHPTSEPLQKAATRHTPVRWERA